MLSPCAASLMPASEPAFPVDQPAVRPHPFAVNARRCSVDARQLAGPALSAALCDSRALTWARVNDLTPAQWQPPLQAGVNPIAWELAHLAWFAEFWVLRGPHDRAAQGLTIAQHPPKFAGPDAHLDSARMAHPARWTTPLPTRAQLDAMLGGQLQACIDTVPAAGDDASLYLHRLALFHEDMHGEALCWLRAALGYPAPADLAVPQVPASRPLSVRGGPLQIGVAAHAPGFAFDNERPGLGVDLKDFEIDSAPVTALAFARFVDAGGYDAARYWPGDAGVWRARSRLDHPQQWRRDPTGNRSARGCWQMRWFDQWLTLESAMPAMHLNAFEAEAYCLWAGRRLPSAAQWECAALQVPALHWGHSVWEWTCDTFTPYPGFAPGPYGEYSAPWFGDHRELRGGAFATHARLHHARYRNFFLPQRTDVFAGFRTVAPC